jgi:hypothetical protein
MCCCIPYGLLKQARLRSRGSHLTLRLVFYKREIFVAGQAKRPDRAVLDPSLNSSRRIQVQDAALLLVGLPPELTGM